MAKQGAKQAAAKDLAKFFRMGGMRVGAGFPEKAKNATKSLVRRNLEASQATRKQGAKLYRALKGAATINAKDPANKKALNALLDFHKKFAGKKLPFPKVPGGLGGFFPGSYSGTVVAPFDFADTIPLRLAGNSDPVISASASVNGQISGSAATAVTSKSFNGGSEYARVGIFFHPMTQGTLTISSAPTYSFAWSTNSLNTTEVRSQGSVGLTIYGMDEMGRIFATGGGLYESWDNTTTGEIDLNFRSNVQKSLAASLAVGPGLVYLCFVEVFVFVMGMGWPGSLATAMASATVPSIGFAFQPQLVAA